MAAGKYQEFSSSRFSNCKHQVFLSFRGSDTRKNFTDHLYTALVQAGIHTFRDDDEIQRGQNIELEIQKAIQQSKISIIVLSKDYAWSRWCLDELVMIMERKRNANSMVLPIFYDVDPSQVTVFKGVFNVAVSDEDGMVKFYEEEEEEWIIQKEFVGLLSFQIASPAAHRICAFNLFTRFCITPETLLCGSVYLEIRNNTSGRSLFCPASFFPSGYKHGNAVIQSLSHWKLGVDDPTFGNGDDVSISVLPLDPTIQIMMVGILWLHEEEGNGDGDKIQPNNKVVASQCSSTSNREVIATHNSSDEDGDAHLAKVEIASRIFRNYSCAAHYNPGNLDVCSWLFEKKGMVEEKGRHICLASSMVV